MKGWKEKSHDRINVEKASDKTWHPFMINTGIEGNSSENLRKIE